MSAERWLPVPGYEGRYDVSDHGRVRSNARPGSRGGVLKQSLSASGGYPYVGLRRDGTARTIRVHRLVMLAFVGPCPAGLEVRHLDGKRANASLENLAYGTRSENNRDAVRHGTNRNAARTHCPRNHPYEGDNLAIRSGGRRACLTCAREHNRQYRARQRAAA